MGRDNFLTIVQLLTPNGQSMIDDDVDALKVTFPSTASLAVKQVSGAADSVNIVQQDITLQTQQVSGATDSMSLVGQTVTLETRQVSGATDSMLAKLTAMTTNPAAAADGVQVNQVGDKIGRAVMTPVQVRELRTTATVTLTTGTEAQLVAGGGAGVFLDLVEIAFANESTAAVTVALRDTLTGGIVDNFRCPADSTVGVSLTVPKPQNEAGNAWTVDMDDVTGTTVKVSALFVKNS